MHGRNRDVAAQMWFSFQERYVTILNLLLVTAVAYFAALAANDVISLRLLKFRAPSVAHAAIASPTSTTPMPRTAYDLIVKRDIFNLTLQRAPAQPAVEAAHDLPVRLLGTSLSSLSAPVAIFEDTRNGVQTLYRRGDNIPNAGTLIEVGRDRAIIKRDGQALAVELAGKDLMDAALAVPHLDGTVAALEVQKQSGPADHRFVLDRATVDKNLDNMPRLFTEIRAVPNLVAGGSNGFRIVEMQPGSIFQQLGLEPGDIVTAVNGQSVADPARAIQLLPALRGSSSLAVVVLRGGSPVELHYRIR